MSNPYGGSQEQPYEGWSSPEGTEASCGGTYSDYPGKQYLDPYTGAPIDDPYAGQQLPAQPYPTQPYPGQPYPGPPQPYRGYPPKTNGTAIGALITSLLGLTLCFVSAPVGAILGHVALGQIKRTGDQGYGMAMVAVIVGWLLTAVGIAAWVWFILIVRGENY